MPALLTADERARLLNAYFDAMSDPVPFVPDTLEAWERRAEELRPQLAWVLGLNPLPDRLPLDVRITGERDEGDYTVTRLYWQSWEGFYASGWLYRPKDLSSSAPAVLNPHGHWANGARHPVVQSRLIGLAKKGYVALAVDSVHCSDFPIGLSSLTVMTWNNIRGLDLLCSLPEVDANRIGCTGASGGGQQTMYVAALDDRITATVNVCLVTWFKKILFSTEQTHCICNHVPGLLSVTDEPEVVSLIAPRPSLYPCVTGDWTATFPHDEFPQIARIYALYGKRQDVDVEQWDWGHDYHQPIRERMYGWFNRYLRGNDDPEAAREPEIRVRPVEELDTLSAPIPNIRPWTEFPAHYRSLHAKQGGELTRERLLRLLGKDKRDVAAPPELGGRSQNGSRLVSGLSGFPVPVSLSANRQAQDAARGKRLAVILHPDGRASVGQEISDALRAKGWDAAMADVRLRGEVHIKWELNTIVWGRPEVGMAVDDLRALLNECAGDYAEIACVGLGEMGVVALAAGALDERFFTILCPNVGDSFTGGRRATTIPHLLRFGDLPDMARLCAPRTVFLGVSPEQEAVASGIPNVRTVAVGAGEAVAWTDWL